MRNWTMNLLILGVILSLPMLANPAGATEMEAGGRLLLANPVGDFGEATDNFGFGLEGHWGVRPVECLTIGLGANFMIYGSEKRTMSLPLVEDFDLTTTNNMAGMFAFAQYRPIEGALQPYVEGRAGLNYIWTESKLEDEDWWDADEVARETNFDDFAGFVAGGGGLLIRLKEGMGESGGTDLYLDMKVTYRKGFKAEYLAEGDVDIVDNQPVYHVSESDTDMMNYQVGVVVTF